DPLPCHAMPCAGSPAQSTLNPRCRCSTRHLRTPPRPPPPLPLSTPPKPVAATAARSAGLVLLEAAQLESSEGDHRTALDLTLKVLAPQQEFHGGWSLHVARALRLAGASASRVHGGVGAYPCSAEEQYIEALSRQDERPDCRNDAVLEIKKLIEVNFQDQLDFASFEASGLQTLN
ncbi:unnamed protein product, partial [Urochloa humidicola]